MCAHRQSTLAEPSPPGICLLWMRPICEYLDYSGRADALAGGVRMIPIETPGGTHEYLLACDSYLPAAGIEYYYYDQLGSAFSDQPQESALWELERFVDEVEQVRRCWGWSPTASCSTATRGAESWPSNTRLRTRARSGGW